MAIHQIVQVPYSHGEVRVWSDLGVITYAALASFVLGEEADGNARRATDTEGGR